MSVKSTFTIPHEHLLPYREIGEHLRHKSRFTLPPELAHLVQDFVDHHLLRSTTTIPAGSTYYRARIMGLGKNLPFPCAEMGAPPSDRVGPGRINPEGISYLYLAENPETALAEVRPWKGAYVSVGQFLTDREAKVISLSVTGTLGQTAGDNRSSIQVAGALIRSEIINSIYFSAPAHQEDKLAYLPSQYISELFKSRGIEGLQYKSVLHEGGVNLVLFDPSYASCKQTQALRVNAVSYDAENFSATSGA